MGIFDALLPVFRKVVASKIPIKAERPGAIYFVKNDDGTPLGIALGEDDESLKFYAALPTQGDTGAVGAAGANGVTYDWLTGAAVPATGLGKVGDMYINTATQDVYKKTATTVWTIQCNIKGATGATGVVGATGAVGAVGATGAKGDTGAVGAVGANGVTYDWLTGAAVPATGLGKVGDMYINTATQDVYKKTATTVWTIQCNIKGATGAVGATGAKGDTGTTGAKGDKGDGLDPIMNFDNWVGLKGYYKVSSVADGVTVVQLYKTVGDVLTATMKYENLTDGQSKETFTYGGYTVTRTTSPDGLREEIS